MLNPNAQLWVDALLSGDYQQTRRALRNQDGYCCLGVACEVARKHGVLMSVTRSPCGDQLIYAYDGSREILPYSVTEWLGLTSNSGKLNKSEADHHDGEHTEFTSLIDMNDNGVSFQDIARVIQSRASDLFREDIKQC